MRRDRNWLEMELFQQLNRAYGAALAKAPDVISAIARGMRRSCLAAAREKDRGALEIGLKHFNNFLREAIKRGDLHATYDVLFQYRECAEKLWVEYPERVLRIAEHLSIYAILALEMGSYLCRTVAGQAQVESMIIDDIAAAKKRGDLSHASELANVLDQFRQHHANREDGNIPAHH